MTLLSTRKAEKKGERYCKYCKEDTEVNQQEKKHSRSKKRKNDSFDTAKGNMEMDDDLRDALSDDLSDDPDL